MDAPWYDDVSLPALLRHARQTYASAMRAALVDAGHHDIPKNGLYLIGGLALETGRAPLARLIQGLRVSKQAAGQLVDALVAAGYLERSPDPVDRRRLTVSLTARGHAAAQVQGAARARIDAALLARVGAQDLAALRRSLGALIELDMAPQDATR